jgi:hypothetical protein
VNGSCDAIYGTSSIVFEQCTIAITFSVTAHRGNKFMWNDARGRRSNLIFYNSSLVKPARGEFAFPAKEGGTVLGRPWGPLAAVTFHECFMDSHIAPHGWDDWGHRCSDGLDGGANCTPTIDTCVADDHCTFADGNSSCWCQNVTYVELGSRGPGAPSPSARVRWAHTVTPGEDHSGGILGKLGLAGALPQVWRPLHPF